MLSNAASVRYFAPEIVLGLGAVVLLLINRLVTFPKWRVRSLVIVALAMLAVAGLAAGWLHSQLPPGGQLGLFQGLLVLDEWAIFFKVIAVLAVASVALMAPASGEVDREHMGEMIALLMVIAVGLCLMAAAGDLLIAVVGVELVSLPSYALAGFRKRNRRSAEAALKYVIYGSVASGLMLFGISWLYGMAGSTSLSGLHDQLAEFLGRGRFATLAVGLSLVLVASGVGFKVTAVPWHMWCPDVYEGAPTPFTAFLSVAPKAAGLALLMRLLSQLPDVSRVPWPEVAGLVAALTMTLGNLAAMSQTNLKRLLAYSSIAHAGYLLTGVAAASREGADSVALYVAVYLFMNVGAFLVVATLARRGDSEVVYDYKGLASRAPFVAITMAVFLFSLGGLPPLAGFVGKFHVFKALIERGEPWRVGLAMLGLFNSVLSLYYYTRVIKAMFLDRPTTDEPIEVPRTYGAMLGFLAAGVVLLGVSFEGLRRLAATSATLFR